MTTQWDERALAAFHRGDRAALESCYRNHFRDVERSAGSVLRGVADRENVVHDVFARLLADEALRRHFTGGAMGAWLTTITRNQALDYAKRYAREVPAEAALVEASGVLHLEDQLAARDVLRRFAARVPSKWAPVFEACFVRRLDQRAAAVELGMSRTTLAYQWLRLKWLLERFVLDGGVT
jgi:RNA polymerase sigma-70 factor (ECF subfamily)